jgi:hypothetical protein
MVLLLRNPRRLAYAAILVGVATSAAVAAAADESDFFERKIRPVLIEHCYECHARDADDIMGGLRLDNPDAMLRGGDSGAAVMPGEPDQSLLLAAIRYDGMEMPPSGPLGASIIRDFETWIESGATDPRQASSGDPVEAAQEIDWDAARQFWAFRPPVRQELPRSIEGDGWGAGRIDSFVLSRLDDAGLTPSAAADRRTLLRRLTFDLVGLPPTLAQMESFLADDRPGSRRRLVDRLLSTPQHAQRWARLWLDLARFAEDQAHKVGNNDSLTYPNAYLYRDWVVDALANDLPYDQFVRMQLAADLIAADDADAQVALGYLGLGPKYYRRSSPEVMADEWEDRVDTVARGLLGLTVACARCHDHKYDPIPTSDYYAMAGVFASTEMYNRPLDLDASDGGRDTKKPQDAVHIVREGKPHDLNVMIRGDVNKAGPVAERAFLTVLSGDGTVRFDRGSGREQLADAIVDRSNPLTARVIVNRIWAELIGQPLVRTPSNFGRLGELPTHPELLDDLAVRFMDNGWSLKWLQREIVMSATYGQSSYIDMSKSSVDPQNELLWRMPRRRLSVEAYRDAVLTAAGRLDHRIGGPSLKPDDPESRRRTLYSEVSRMDLNPMLARFDFPDPNAHSPRRFETTTPLQKLFLLNSPFLVRQSEALAQRLESHGGSRRSRIEYAYTVLFGRQPTESECLWGESFLADAGAERWEQYAQTLLISNEMFMID